MGVVGGGEVFRAELHACLGRWDACCDHVAQQVGHGVVGVGGQGAVEGDVGEPAVACDYVESAAVKPCASGQLEGLLGGLESAVWRPLFVLVGGQGVRVGGQGKCWSRVVLVVAAKASPDVLGEAFAT